ncbi:hypothetical protein IW262DRAFT_1291291 [Armillaria fumosa]|nr:hypothetical protein IW262DRAFT_1291291 [Armillaria fumosa]
MPQVPNWTGFDVLSASSITAEPICDVSRRIRDQSWDMEATQLPEKFKDMMSVGREPTRIFTFIVRLTISVCAIVDSYPPYDTLMETEKPVGWPTMFPERPASGYFWLHELSTTEGAFDLGSLLCWNDDHGSFSYRKMNLGVSTLFAVQFIGTNINCRSRDADDSNSCLISVNLFSVVPCKLGQPQTLRKRSCHFGTAGDITKEIHGCIRKDKACYKIDRIEIPG